MSNSRICHLHWRCDFSRTHYLICAIEIAPPFVMLSEAKHLVIASERRERGNQQAKNPDQARIPTRLIATLTLAMTHSQNHARFQARDTSPTPNIATKILRDSSRLWHKPQIVQFLRDVLRAKCVAARVAMNPIAIKKAFAALVYRIVCVKDKIGSSAKQIF